MARKVRRPEMDLIDAALEADWETVFALLGDGAPPTATDREGRTALHYAAADGLVSMIGLLLKHGARPTALDARDITPLHFAVKAYAPAAAMCLMKHGAEIDAQDIEGNTPLHYAILESAGRGEMIRTLLALGARIDLPNATGQTAENLGQSHGIPLHSPRKAA